MVRAKARGFFEGLLKYETVLTAQIYLRIFQETTPLSKYLQTVGMDILTAQGFVETVEDKLKKFNRDFESVKSAANVFVKWANDLLEKHECDAEVQSALPEKRVRKKKVMPGEKARDEPPADAETDFKVNVHNEILATVTTSIHDRFAANAVLCSDFACMNPKNFPAIRTKGLQKTALEELSKCLRKFNEDATVETLQEELMHLANQWETLKMHPLGAYQIRKEVDEEGDSEAEEGLELQTKCSSCRNCPICCYNILSHYNLLSHSYHTIGQAYKFMLTLSVTQVACERTFSTLKFVKNRLRSSMSQDRLEAFLLMSTQKETLMDLDVDSIIDKVAETSALMRRQLTF